MTRKLTRNVLAATALAGLFSAMAATTAVSERARKQTSKASVACDGGALEAVYSDTQDSPQTSASTDYVQVGSTIPAEGSPPIGGDADLYMVTFAGEAFAVGGGYWNAKAQISVDGGAFVEMNPTGPNVFHRGNGKATHSMTWCTRTIATVTIDIRIVWAKAGGAVGSQAGIDDFIISVQRYN